MKELEKRQKIINKNKEEILNRIKLIQQSKFDEKNDHDQRELLPEQMIYKLNLGNGRTEKLRMLLI